MKILGGKVCDQDLAEIMSRYGEPVAVQVGHRMNPYVTNFMLKDGTMGIVSSIAPTYYLHRNGEHRPFGEVALRHGNANIILNDNWRNIDPIYLNWLKERQRRMFGTELMIVSPYSMKDSLVQLSSLFPRMAIGLTVFTGYPASGAVDPVDGLVWRGSYPNGVVETFATIRAGAGTAVSSTQTNAQINMEVSSTTDRFEQCARFLGVFDTSSITSGSTVSDASIGFCAASKGDEGIGVPDIHAFWASVATNSALATGDYVNNQASGSLGSIAYASISTGTNSTTYNTITLSAYTNINMGTSARTKIGLGHKWDVTNSTSGFTWAAGHLNSYVNTYFADAASAGKPKLIVTYTAGASTNSGFFGLM